MTELCTIDRVTDREPFVIYADTVDRQLPVKVRTFSRFAASLCQRAQLTDQRVWITYHDWHWGVCLLDAVKLEHDIDTVTD